MSGARRLRSRVLSAILAGALLAPASALVSEDAHARRKKKETLAESLASAVSQRIDAALVKAPADEEACYSPDEPCDLKLVKFIDSARASIDVAVFDITHDQIVHHLLLQARKIPVRIVVDRRQSKGEHSLVRTLIKGGANVRIGRQRGVMHNKFTIVDGRMIETGSYNYTNNATENNAENQIYLAKPAIVARYKERFEKLWGLSTAPKPDKE